jgi:hypothetical protein
MFVRRFAGVFALLAFTSSVKYESLSLNMSTKKEHEPPHFGDLSYKNRTFLPCSGIIRILACCKA